MISGGRRFATELSSPAPSLTRRRNVVRAWQRPGKINKTHPEQKYESLTSNKTLYFLSAYRGHLYPVSLYAYTQCEIDGNSLFTAIYTLCFPR